MTIIENNYIDIFCDELKKLKSKKIFIVCGRSSFLSSGLKEDLDQVFIKVGVQKTYFFSDFSPNPQYHDLQKGLRELLLVKPDCIIGAGGGSVIDMAKLLRFFYSYQGNVETNGPYLLNKSERILPLICLPSTSGTGAEVTHFAVLYKNGIKYSIADSKVLPDLAIVASKYTYNNDAYLTACTGFDALSQAIESFWNVKSTSTSEEFAIEAIKKIFHNLPRLIRNPTKELRDQVSEGSVLAGKAINITQTTAPHAYSYFLTSEYGYSHGHAVALFFPYFFKWNSEALKYYKEPKKKHVYKNKIDKLLAYLGVENRDKEYFFIEYIESLGISVNLGKNTNIDNIVSAVNHTRLQNNPMDINTNSLKEYLKEMIKKSF